MVEAALAVLLFVLPANFRAWPLATAFLCPHTYHSHILRFVARRATIAEVVIPGMLPAQQCVYIAPSFALCGFLPRPFQSVSMPCAWSPFRSPRSSLPRPLPP
jgi:hypothetical protein